MSRGLRVSVVTFLVGVAVLGLVWSSVIWIAGGLNVSLAGIRITSNVLWRPLLISGVAVALLCGLNGPRRTFADVRSLVGALTPARSAVALAVLTMTVSLLGNSWTASGADSSAYLSQAEMFRTGHFESGVALASTAPWPDPVTTFAPFGYRRAVDGRPVLVPVTAAGLPLIMAALQRVAGHCAAFLVTPLAAGVLVLVTFALGRDVRSPSLGLWAAWLVATSPAFLFMLMWPMSDVPAAAAAALMIWLVLKGERRSAFFAGVSGALCFLLRANLAPVVAATWLWLFIRSDAGPIGRRWHAAAAFSTGVLPGVLLTMWLNERWYGSPFASGYGAAGDLLGASRIPENAARYMGWLAATSPAAIAGIVALCLPRSAWLWKDAAGRRSSWLLTFLATGVGAVYLFYQTFTDWWYLRFLLPAWPALFIGAATWIDLRPRGSFVRWVTVTVFLLSGFGGLSVARARGVFGLGVEERRYVSVVRLVEATTEPDAVILTSQHAGTVRVLHRPRHRPLRQPRPRVARPRHCVARYSRAPPVHPHRGLGTSPL